MLVRSFKGIFSKQASITDWLNDLSKKLETNLNAELKSKLSDGVVDLADSVQQMAKLIDLKIKQSNTAVMRTDSYLFEDISDKRAATLKDLQDAFARFMSRSDSFADERLFPANAAVSPNIAAGSGAALIGMLIMGVTNTAVFDITGGVLTGIGLLFAGITAGVQRRKIVQGYHEEIGRGRQRMTEALDEKLRHYVRTIKGKISENFVELDAMLENEQHQIKHLDEKYGQLRTRLTDLDKGLDVE
jgi:hypothetical protein